MLNYDSFDYHPTLEKLVSIFEKKTQYNSSNFFRVLITYNFAKLASIMRTVVATDDRGDVPVNCYAINLAPSGQGKGFAMDIMEENIIEPFKNEFLEGVYKIITEDTIRELAVDRASKNMGDVDAEYDIALKEFDDMGHFLFSFDSGTTPAFKQLRHKLLMAGSGALSLEVDEIGNNLVGNIEIFNTLLETYNNGKVKQKLIKNTTDNKRSQEIDGKVPTNMLLFGTPNKLFDSGKIWEEFVSMLDTGFGRRCLFGYSSDTVGKNEFSADELYDILTDKSIDTDLQDIGRYITTLSAEPHFNKKLTMSKAAHILLLNYKIDCENRARELPEHQELQRTELVHRFYKVLKTAGGYAFIDASSEVTVEHLQNAIKLAEISGKDYLRIITPKKPYETLAHFIAETPTEISQVDLIENLNFYKGTEQHKRSLMNLAIAYGYKHNIIIQRSWVDNIEFFTGSKLEETNLNEITIAYSDELAKNFKPTTVPYKDLHKVFTKSQYAFTVHEFKGEYRERVNVIKGFNLIVLDIDSDVDIATVQMLLSDYKYTIYTTKRHTDLANRFRVILPMSHTLRLDSDTYSKFMENVFNWLPFPVDSATKDIARKWAGNDTAEVFNNDGELIDSTLFIPKTKKEEEFNETLRDCESLTSMEKWFVREIQEGNRNNMMYRYGCVLKDIGYPIDVIRDMIESLNKKLGNPLDDIEIGRTIMINIAKRVKNA